MPPWTPEEAAELERQAQVDPEHRWDARPFPRSPHGLTEEGLQDYRRVPLPALVRFDIIDVDLTGARSTTNAHGVDVGIQLSSCRCRNVSFDRAGRFVGLHGVFDSCRFDRVSTDHCGLNGLYRDCSFDGANLRGAMLAGDFVRCSFRDTNLLVDGWGGSFEECSFVGCRTSGLFSHIQTAIGRGEPVTFSLTINGGIKVGETIRHFNDQGLLQGWEGEGVV